MLLGFLAFLAVFGLLVTVHELGHLIFAKRAGIMCPEFAIGMGPKIFSFKHNDTLYTIRLLPVGGYVRMASQDMEINPLNAGMRIQVKLNENEEITHVLLDDKHNFTQVEEVEIDSSDIQREMYITAHRLHDNSFVKYHIAEEAYFVENANLERIAPADMRFEGKSPWQKFQALFAGPLFNFLLAFVLFTIVFFLTGKNVDEPIVGSLSEGLPAEESGLVVDDRINSINGRSIETWTDMTEVIQDEGAVPLELEVERAHSGEVETLTMTPELITEELAGEQVDRLVIGIGAKFERGVFEPLLWGAQETVEMSTLIFTLVVELFISIFEGEFSFDMLNGPVGIAVVTNEMAQQGFIVLMRFTAMLSVNLGIMNLLPIPALDGGRILFVLYEGIFRRPVNRRVEINIQVFGVLFVLMIMILVTWNDIQNFFFS
ncbi:MAG TPA: RIP metalloprotease RseP [Aliicoccus persicus]|uniref:Zinc metalloprotease n=1 Tax=Aliicoccus persicus TaxID=930138 RepID=A0A921JAX6_9STAP|nr:RIP metalloprotease RseP [Aliicoccus persicus]